MCLCRRRFTFESVDPCLPLPPPVVHNPPLPVPFRVPPRPLLFVMHDRRCDWLAGFSLVCFEHCFLLFPTLPPLHAQTEILRRFFSSWRTGSLGRGVCNQSTMLVTIERLASRHVANGGRATDARHLEMKNQEKEGGKTIERIFVRSSPCTIRLQRDRAKNAQGKGERGRTRSIAPSSSYSPPILFPALPPSLPVKENNRIIVSTRLYSQNVQQQT